MNTRQIKDRIKSLTRDFDGMVFREADLNMYINEAIDRISGCIPELKGMKHIKASDDKPILLPDNYHYLIAVYGASRCFSQDERHYQAGTLMNEFEIKLDELKTRVEAEEEFIYDENGNRVKFFTDTDYVVDNYFF